MNTIIKLLSNKALRELALPLIQELAEWIRGRKGEPVWLSLAEAERRDLQYPAAQARAEARRNQGG